MLPSLMSMASGFLSKKKKVSQQPMMPGFQMETGQLLADYLKKNLGNYTPGESYGGDLTSESTPFEQFGLGTLSDYLRAPATGDAFAAGKKNLMDTLGGKYTNPNENPFIQALTGLSKQNLNDATNDVRGRAGARGKYFSTAAMKQEGDLQERTQNYLNTIIGQIQEQERGRQFSAIPEAMRYDEYGTATAPLKQVAASQTFGSLERLIDEGNMERMYEDFTRQRDELSQLPGQAQNLYGTNVNYGVPSVTKNQPNQLLDMLSKLNWGALGKGGGQIWDIFKPSTAGA